MKVIINRCYGGFGLSLLAQKMYLERKGQTPFFYEETQYSFKNGYNGYTKILDSELEKQFGFSTLVTLKDLGDSFNYLDENEHIPSGSPRKSLPTYHDYKELCSWYYGRDPFSTNIRTDPDLISVIEEIGTKKASGECSSLNIVEIPDDVEFEIENYDGMESIEEIHRSWY